MSGKCHSRFLFSYQGLLPARACWSSRSFWTCWNAGTKRWTRRKRVDGRSRTKRVGFGFRLGFGVPILILFIVQFFGQFFTRFAGPVGPPGVKGNETYW